MIYVIRHGQTDFNLEGKLQGRNGLPLNSTGLKQAALLKEHLQNINFNAIYSSPQERAIKTAQIISGQDVVSDYRLDVFDLGDADGLTRKEAVMKNGIPDSKVHKGVENPEVFVKRIFGFMKELESKYDKDDNILICGHRCTTGCIGAYFEGIPEDKNILIYSSDTGDFKVYDFSEAIK